MFHRPILINFKVSQNSSHFTVFQRIKVFQSKAKLKSMIPIQNIFTDLNNTRQP